MGRTGVRAAVAMRKSFWGWGWKEEEEDDALVDNVSSGGRMCMGGKTWTYGSMTSGETKFWLALAATFCAFVDLLS